MRFAFAFLLLACARPYGTSDAGSDAGGMDSGSIDAGSIDGGPTDAAMVDAGVDAGPPVEASRGMYVSLYSTGIGAIEFGGETEMHRLILGDAAKEDALLAFAQAHGVDSMSLYDLNVILSGSAAIRAALASFMIRARERGIVRFDAIGATSLAAWDRIAAFHRDEVPFDGLLTEIEFWNASATLDALLSTLQYMRGLGLVDRFGDPVDISVYVGWLDASEARAIAPLVDRVYVHAYVDSPTTAWGYIAERVGFFETENAAQGLSVELRPIFSAEDTAWSAGAEHFMGEWLAANSIDEAETILNADASGRFASFQYYDYFFLERYVTP